MNFRDIFTRAAKTALQTFLALVTAQGVGVVDATDLETFAIAAGAAALSVIQNALNGEYQRRKGA